MSEFWRTATACCVGWVLGGAICHYAFPTSTDWRVEAIKHGAAHYEVNDKGEVSFVWNNPKSK